MFRRPKAWTIVWICGLLWGGVACEHRVATSVDTAGAVILDPDRLVSDRRLDKLALGERLPAFAVKYRNPDNQFELLFPRSPRVDRQLLKTTNGNVELVTIACDYSVVKAYWASYSDYPTAALAARDPRAVLEEARESVIRNLGERTIFTVLQDSTRFGFPSQRFRARDAHFHAEYELVLVRNRLYQFGVLRDGDYPPAADVEAFFSGFRLIP